MGKPRPICFPCAKEMRCEKNDYAVKDKATETFPATVWLGDMFMCPLCHGRVVINFGEGRTAHEVSDSTLEEAQEFKR